MMNTKNVECLEERLTQTSSKAIQLNLLLVTANCMNLASVLQMINLYICQGGFSKYFPITKCQRYDIELDFWIPVQPMNQSRYRHSSCQLGGFIYVLSGYDDNHKSKSVEKLGIDVGLNQW